LFEPHSKYAGHFGQVPFASACDGELLFPKRNRYLRYVSNPSRTVLLCTEITCVAGWSLGKTIVRKPSLYSALIASKLYCPGKYTSLEKSPYCTSRQCATARRCLSGRLPLTRKVRSLNSTWILSGSIPAISTRITTASCVSYTSVGGRHIDGVCALSCNKSELSIRSMLREKPRSSSKESL